MTICLPCKHRQQPGTCAGACLCYFDKANPVDLRQRRETGCPLGLKPIPIRIARQPRSFAPGNVAAAVIRWLGYEPKSGCSCKSFQAKMNAWGWLGCLWRWREIVAHFWHEWRRR